MIVNNIKQKGLNMSIQKVNKNEVFKFIQENIVTLVKKLETSKSLKLPFEVNGSSIKNFGLELEKLSETENSLRLTAFNNKNKVAKMLTKGSNEQIIQNVQKPNYIDVIKSNADSLEYYINLGG